MRFFVEKTAKHQYKLRADIKPGDPCTWSRLAKVAQRLEARGFVVDGISRDHIVVQTSFCLPTRREQGSLIPRLYAEDLEF